MVVSVCGRINVESSCKTSIAFEAKTFVITFDLRSDWVRVGVARQTLDVLCSYAAGAGDGRFGGTGACLVACCLSLV